MTRKKQTHPQQPVVTKRPAGTGKAVARIGPAPLSAALTPAFTVGHGPALRQRRRQILTLQRQVGNNHVQNLLRRRLWTAARGRPAGQLQRWEGEGGEGVAQLETYLRSGDATISNLRRILHSLESNVGAENVTVETGVGSTTIPLAAASEIRTLAADTLKLRLMEALHADRRKLVTAMEALVDDADRHAYMRRLHTTDQEWLRQLRAISSGSDWRHPDGAVQDSVLAAFQLDAVVNAEADLDSPEGAQKAAVKATQMSAKGDWCGMFVSTNYMRATLDKDLKAGMFHVKNVEDYFIYRYHRNRKRIKKWIFVDGAWNELQEYHKSRGAERSWITTQDIKDGGALDIRAGDVVLIDHEADGRPNHIVMAHSYNPHTRLLVTIGGNDSGFEVDQRAEPQPPKKESEARREKRELAEAATGRNLKKGGTRYEETGKRRVGVGVKDLDAKKVKVYGIGRPSIVDFEDHIYNPSKKKPVAVPGELAPTGGK